ncbi:hypothetical protein MPF_1295 [Methanohalophilus portucalensis FDF-1]|uniref:Uncharacterized protein n=1 Tax=Methanohalophilus portucalensis FDF-1 TaxID=523843 RepID=A0A1L9C4U5_9EURY|nr:hypothetical protein MPF_1295 [Methanohalophilus portucalensis FDF-1]
MSLTREYSLIFSDARFAMGRNFSKNFHLPVHIC